MRITELINNDTLKKNKITITAIVTNESAVSSKKVKIRQMKYSDIYQYVGGDSVLKKSRVKIYKRDYTLGAKVTEWKRAILSEIKQPRINYSLTLNEARRMINDKIKHPQENIWAINGSSNVKYTINSTPIKNNSKKTKAIKKK